MSCEKECKLGKTYCCMECPSYDICREKRKNKKSGFEKAVKWIAVSIAVIAGIKMTGSAWCLWAFAIVQLAFLVLVRHGKLPSPHALPVAKKVAAMIRPECVGGGYIFVVFGIEYGIAILLPGKIRDISPA